MIQILKKDERKKTNLSIILIVTGVLSLAGCSTNKTSNTADKTKRVEKNKSFPAKHFDLSHWKLTLPTDSDSDGKVDDISNAKLQSFSHDDYFNIDERGHLVFTSPNRGGTTVTSSNTRSELRYLSNARNRKISSHDPLNNFAVASHPNANKFGSVGHKMEATLHIDHAPRNSNKPSNKSSYSAVIGQIHAIKYKNNKDSNGFGYGNEPLKIFYKKWPNHETGSVYWNYERNLAKGDPKRKDISNLVWGKSPRDSSNPGQQGIALGEDFSYTVNVYKDTMYLVFESPRLGTVRHEINLANNIDANGNVDSDDNPKGYTGDGNYFKAGVYNQCRAAVKKNETIAPCPGTGDWTTDKVNGDYAQVSFSRLVVSEAVKPEVQ